MLSRGELCRGCGNKCEDEPTVANRLEIEDVGDRRESWCLSECPRKFAADVTDAVNLAQVADSHLPVSGGVLDQAAWWVDLWLAFKSDCGEIDQDKIDRERARYG